MKKGKVWIRVVSIGLALFMTSSVLVSMMYKSNADNSSTSSANIGDNISAETSVEQQISLDEANMTNDMIEERLNKRVHLVKLATPVEVEEYLKQKSVDTNEDEDITRVDNSKSKYFPRINNQGSLGSCTAWATAYYQMTYTVNKALDRDSSDTGNVFSPTWIYTMINSGENKGTYYTDALKILSEIGAVSINSVPAITTETSVNIKNIKAKKDVWLEANKYRVKEYYTINLGNDSKWFPKQICYPQSTVLDGIKNALLNGEIITCSTYGSSSWIKEKIVSNEQVAENSLYEGQNIITRLDDVKDAGGHRVTIVGYNDHIWVDINKNNYIDEGEKGAFKIANSWGARSDNEGFFWVSYDAVNVKSSVNSNKNVVDLDPPKRKPALIDAIGYTVDVDNPSDLFFQLDIETNNAKAVEVVISATSRINGHKYEYSPVPFSNSDLIQSVGEYQFYSYSGTSATFMIDLNNVIDKVNANDIDNYDWKITVNDGVIDNEGVKIKNAQFYDSKNDKYYDTNLKDTVTVKDEFYVITNSDVEPSYDEQTINDEIYGFSTDKKSTFKFSTPSKYYDKRYYNIYVLDSEYKGKLADLEKNYVPDISTNNGAAEIEIKKGKYVYCVAKNKSIWTAVVYKNLSKLTIQIKK